MERFWKLIIFLIFLMGCSNTPRLKYDEENKESILKYPVILVHGIVAHDRKSLIDFWGRIPETFAANGIKVYLGNTDSWGSFESNAEILKGTIDKVLQETGSEKVNIIAHSKGGLDSRFTIWKYNYGEKVASLTTICTPHHGAEIADFVFLQKIIHKPNSRKILKTFGEWYGDTNPDMYNVNYQLTTFKMREFNEEVTMDEKVYYQSVYTTMRNAFDDLMMFNSYIYIKKISGDNDGTVSEKSAKWSPNTKRIDGISHAEIIDYKKYKISGIHIPDIYMDIVRDLGERGF